MKPIVLKFVGGYWDGRSLRSDSPDRQEVFLAAGCYEMSHHGAVGGECLGLSDGAVAFAQSHGWNAAKEAGLCGGDHRYVATERLETEAEIVVTFKQDLIRRTTTRSRRRYRAAGSTLPEKASIAFYGMRFLFDSGSEPG